MAEKASGNNINLMNMIRAQADINYSGRIPQATENNINSIYERLLDTNAHALRNAFVNSLIGQIMYQRIETCAFRNFLGVLKKTPMKYGNSEQEIFVNFAKGYQFNMFPSAEDLFKFYKSNVMTAYHTMSPPLQYAVSLSFDDLRTAFRDEYGIRSLINAKVESLVSGAEWDEYLIMKQIAGSAYDAGHLYAVQAPEILDDASSKEFTIQLKTIIEKMKFPNPLYNVAGATSFAKTDGIYYMVTPETDARLSVEVLAYAFNMSEAEVKAHKIVVDSFPNENMLAFVFDARFFNVREQFRIMSDASNSAGLYWNSFYTISEMFSYSPFFPAVVLTQQEVNVGTISVSGDLNVAQGGQIEIPVALQGKPNAYVPKEVDFEIEGQNSVYTNMIPGSNILMVGNDETATKIKVTVTSRYDTSVSTTADVTVTPKA